MKRRVMTIFGTRPEAIKMAPLVKELEREPEIESIVAVTAQHREMLDQVLDLFAIRPDYDLDIMEAGQSLTSISVRVLEGLEKVLAEVQPDLVLVHGDTSTSFLAALAAFYQQIRIGHVEAGLRTYNKYSPFPEEMNRQLTGVLTDLHFAPTPAARENLFRENIPAGKIFVTGNTVIDALLQTVQEDYHFNDEILDGIDFRNKKLILLTAHRRENLGQPMEDIFRAVRRLVQKYEELELVFPVHLNPVVRELAASVLGDMDRVHLIEPLDYEPFVNLMARSYLVLTDSGGIQEEAPGLGKPVLVLRNTTERPEAIAAGTVRLVGTDPEAIYQAATELIRDQEKYALMANAVNPYGDGKAARRIVNRIRYEFGLSASPGEEFRI
ncbi:MAG TPA: UDP-N-acetylglucosamine 2-epimerase (non-hydrolyzing) [Halanaerobiaceae bacterium]|jgi:UDP-N-acetylglucosamine 2-epimerase (non-hydrolysing)|nr:UDP-N-acetylglucosamine 2-epimerase (non-hydrolyzing) [Bacillota bacterium]HHU92185.1 UDP-N-acetylglucosamine 2-epimerase (non-hydrolyzing) [Halanaerobiaceae bacterium]HOA41531.1 UDP-N-acetylglucosamine 2-epimerase (non-hydrolyzing) [Halanaerobiales bacterium]HPZ63582.1 UDP-N-acetylglucosamine 2-epimerase (non-hydrolyzing) [Halanaerobiales bacterium]HQD04892.1 UDP-N-acetylglucosamine 2-epimerase (non-hydrolyzing) [Halanaerobiales bacterium]